MAKIRRSDIAEEDIFKGIRDSAQDTIKVFDKLDEEIKQTAKTLKTQIGGASMKDVKAIREFTKAVNAATKAKQQALQIDKQRAKLTSTATKAELEAQRIAREKLKTEREAIRTAEALARSDERKRKAAERNAKAVENERNSYKKLVVETRNNKNESKRLAARLLELEAAGKKNTKGFRELKREYKQVTRAAQEGDAQLKKIDKTVGDNFRNVGNYAGAVNKLKGVLGGLGAAFGVFQVIKSGASIVADFDQAQADLQAISGKTAEEIAGLTEQAKELGATTQFSATQITEMQTELAKLGFTNEQISDSTGAVANFAAATGAEIPRAAALAGSAMRAFGLDASEMDRVVSTLGVATTKTALDFSKLETGLSTVAPVAKSFGFSVEDTTALLGQLANSGFDASSAATATRNILLNLADANGSLAQELGRPIKSADDLAAGLQELQARGIDLGEALELTDKRSVAAFQTFIDGSDSLVELRDSITGANDELEAMAEKRLDTIGGQFTLLQSAWEGFILSLNEGTGVGETVKNLIGFIAENLNTILGIIGKVTTAFIAYRVATSKAAKDLLSFSKGIFTSIKNLKKQDFALKNVGKTAKAAGTAFKSMGKALQSIAFVAIATAIFEVATALWDTVSGAKELREETERQKKALDDTKKSVEKGTQAFQARIKAEQDAIAIARSKGLTEKDALKRQEKFLAGLKSELELSKKVAVGLAKQTFEKLRNVQAEREANKEKLKNIAANRLSDIQVRKLRDADAELAKQERELNNEVARTKVVLDGLNENYEIVNGLVFENTIQTNENTRSTNESHKAKKKINTELKTSIDLQREYNELIDRELEAQQQRREANLEQQAEDINSLLDEQIEKQKALIQADEGFSMEEITGTLQARKDAEIQLIEETRDFEIEAKKQAEAQKIQALRDSLKAERDELLKQENLKQSDIDKINANFTAEMDKVRELELASEATLAEEIKTIRNDANNDILDVEQATADEINAIDKELTDDLIKRGEELKKKDEEDAKKALELEKEKAAARRAVIKAVTDYAIEQSNKRIAQLDKEIQAAEKRSDMLREMAAQGNIDAKESLAEEQRIIREANLAKAKEERRQQRIKAASAIYDTYQSKIEAGSERPLAETIRDYTALQAFISSLPTFLDGTEDTGANGHGIDGKGGFHAVLHPNERVLTKEQNAMVGEISNIELAKIAQDYQAGKLIGKGDNAVQIGGPWQSAEIVRKLDELQHTIKNKPETNIGLERIVDGAMQITRQTRKGNTVIYDRYKVRK